MIPGRTRLLSELMRVRRVVPDKCHWWKTSSAFENFGEVHELDAPDIAESPNETCILAGKLAPMKSWKIENICETVIPARASRT